MLANAGDDLYTLVATACVVIIATPIVVVIYLLARFAEKTEEKREPPRDFPDPFR